MDTLYKSADLFFFTFHIGLILFNLFGWIFPRARKWNLVTLGLTAFSWFVLGIFYGFGYCILTDWHWQIRDLLGYPNLHNSYIQFLLVTVLGVSIASRTVDLVTGIMFLAAVVASVTVNLRGIRGGGHGAKADN